MQIIKRIDAILAEMKGGSYSILPAATRSKINRMLSQGLTSGYPYAKTFGTGLNAAFDVLAKFGIEPAESVSPPLADTGRITVRLAFTNTSDSFSPTDITNVELIVAFTKMNTGVEFVAYLS